MAITIGHKTLVLLAFMLLGLSVVGIRPIDAQAPPIILSGIAKMEDGSLTPDGTRIVARIGGYESPEAFVTSGIFEIVIPIPKDLVLVDQTATFHMILATTINGEISESVRALEVVVFSKTNEGSGPQSPGVLTLSTKEKQLLKGASLQDTNRFESKTAQHTEDVDDSGAGLKHEFDNLCWTQESSSNLARVRKEEQRSRKLRLKGSGKIRALGMCGQRPLENRPKPNQGGAVMSTKALLTLTFLRKTDSSQGQMVTSSSIKTPTPNPTLVPNPTPAPPSTVIPTAAPTPVPTSTPTPTPESTSIFPSPTPIPNCNPENLTEYCLRLDVDDPNNDVETHNDLATVNADQRSAAMTAAAIANETAVAKLECAEEAAKQGIWGCIRPCPDSAIAPHNAKGEIALFLFPFGLFYGYTRLRLRSKKPT